jgi:TRAP-type mannitol/chloroaromatic compound transport system permease small subunit
MRSLLPFSRAIDGLSTWLGKHLIWLILAATIVSAVNAIMRKVGVKNVFGISLNAFLEMQWYLFATSFLLVAGFTLLNNEHVKIDVVYSRWTRRQQIWIDIFGFICFLFPVCLAVIWYSWPFFVRGYVSNEMSSNAGGLIRWPVFMMLPLGFALLLLQGISELIKRFAFLQGLIGDPAIKNTKTAEEELAEEIRRLADEKLKLQAAQSANNAHRA